MKNPIAVLVIVLLIMVALLPCFTVQPVMSAPVTVTVPDDYPTIQEAINNASDGSTIFVRAGTYPEHLTINKPLSLIGEDRNRTIIDAEGKIGLIVSITSDYTRIEGFTFQSASGTYYGYDGVLNFSSSNNIITNNIITNNELCGIALDSSHNNSIVHNDIINNFNGILLTNSTDNVISENTIVGDSRTGILLYGSSNNMIVGNNVSYVDSGIKLMDYEWYDFHCSASNNSLINNTVIGNFQGISIYASPHNTLRNNTLNENYYSLEVSWYMYADNKVSYFIQDIDESNTIDGTPILYLVNHHNEQIESNATYVAAVNCTNLTIKNLQLHSNNEGIVIAGTENSTFQNLNVTNNRYGIYLFESNNNTIYGCNVVGGQVGIALESSWYNHIDHNNVVNTYGEGIILMYSNRNNITYNDLSNNKYRGVLAGLSLENTIAYNTVRDNRMAGIGISSDGNGILEHNMVHDNNIINNTCGVQLGDTSGNLIYNNNFVNNKQQASVSVSYGNIGYGNVWDNGYSSGGNYWSNYNGTDADHDGIGDTPYIIDSSNTDHYPLMHPWELGFLQSDLNRDGIVNIIDITIVTTAYRSTPGTPSWNALADLDKNGIINIVDVTMVAKDYGKTVASTQTFKVEIDYNPQIEAGDWLVQFQNEWYIRGSVMHIIDNPDQLSIQLRKGDVVVLELVDYPSTVTQEWYLSYNYIFLKGSEGLGDVACVQVSLDDPPRLAIPEDGCYIFDVGVVNVDVYWSRDSIGAWTFNVAVISS